MAFRKCCISTLVGLLASLSLLLLVVPVFSPVLAGVSESSLPPVAEPEARLSTAAPLAIEPVLYFVHLGDIWRYDAGSGVVEVVEAAAGRSLGDVSCSVDGSCLAWEERTWLEGRLESKVVFRGPAATPGGESQTWEFPAASSPEVSPDGRYLLYERHDGTPSVLVFFDSAGGKVPAPRVGASNGSWVLGSDGVTLQVAFDEAEGGQPDLGFVILDFQTGRESPRTVADGSSAAQRGRWSPLFDVLDGRCLLTRYASTGRIDVTEISGATTPIPILDVTSADHFDYRWLYPEGGTALPFVEVAPMAVGRSEIYRIDDVDTAAGAALTLLDSSFGWNASLPAEAQFTDLTLGQRYYDAAALLSAEKVISGFPDGTFRPDAPVKRAQFAKMLVGAAGVEVYAGIPRPGFSDVGADVAPLYPVEYVAAASNSRLVRGFKDGLFRPWNTISRAQMVTMVVRAAAMYLPQGLTEPPAGWTGVTWGYDDATHGSNVHLAEYMGLLTGIDLRGWNPSQPASRGEVAQILLNLQRLRSPLVASEHIPALSLASGVLRAGVDSSPVEHQSTGNIVFDGDSLTFGSTATDPYPDQVMRVLRPEIRWVNFGIGGQKLYTMLENAPTKVDPLYDAALGRNVCVIWGGTNDIRWWGHKPPAVYQHLRDYCLGRRVKGFTVVVLTLLPRTDGDYPELFETYRQDVNRRIRQGWVGFADALIDVGADPLIGSAGCEVDLRFFSPDRVHLNNNGLALVAGRVLKLLERVDTPGDERVDAQVAQ